MSEETKKPALQAVTFDLDGLMFNTEDIYQEVGTTILARRDREFTDELRNQMMGRKAPDALQRMIDYHELPDTTDELAEESAEVFAALLVEKLMPMPGLHDLLAALEAAQIPKGIATSSGRVFVDHILRLTDLRDRFAFLLTAEDITHGKPAPDVYLLAAKRHGVQPNEMLVLEDSEIGCRAAIAAGTYCVAVPSEHSSTHQFDGVQFQAKSLADERIFAALSLA